MIPTFLSPQQMIAAAAARARTRQRIADTRPTILKRNLDEQRVDERNIADARGIYFNIAMDRAKSHHNAAPVLGELFTMQLQELALRDAADMIAARIHSGMSRQQLKLPDG